MPGGRSAWSGGRRLGAARRTHRTAARSAADAALRFRFRPPAGSAGRRCAGRRSQTVFVGPVRGRERGLVIPSRSDSLCWCLWAVLIIKDSGNAPWHGGWTR